MSIVGPTKVNDIMLRSILVEKRHFSLSQLRRSDGNGWGVDFPLYIFESVSHTCGEDSTFWPYLRAALWL